MHEHFTQCSHIFSIKQIRVTFSVYFAIVMTDTTQQLTRQLTQQSTNQLGQKWDIKPPCRQRLQEKSTTTLISFISSFLKWKPPIIKNQQQNTQKREMWYYRGGNCLYQKTKCKLLKKHENGKKHYLTYARSPCFLMLLVWRGQRWPDSRRRSIDVDN